MRKAVLVMEHARRKRSRGRRAWFAVAVSLFTAAVCWWWLPQEPRCTLPKRPNAKAAFAPDLRIVAISNDRALSNRAWISTTEFFDTMTGQLLGSFRSEHESEPGEDPVQGRSFSSDGSKLVEVASN